MTATTGSKFKRKHTIQIFILILVCILTAAALFLMPSGEEGSHIQGNAYYEGNFPFKSYSDYSQRDEAWTGDTLGSSKDTMGLSDRLYCCILNRGCITKAGPLSGPDWKKRFPA